jgi:hypothetical protein
MADKPDYKAFAQWAIREGAWDGCDLDGGAIQQKAVELGIIRETTYDPAIHGPNEWDVEPGEQWFIFAESASR